MAALGGTVLPVACSANLALDINTGRQLFVDDALICENHLERRYHYPAKYEGNPVLKPEKPFEISGGATNSLTLPKGGGMWWDSKEGVFKLWYEVGWCGVICYATSPDGIVWTRPDLDVVPGTNQVFPTRRAVRCVDSWSVVKDPHSADPASLYKLFATRGGVNRAFASVSPDGIHWSPYRNTGVCGDRSTMHYNPFRRKWVFSLRTSWDRQIRNYAHWNRRARSYAECDDYPSGAVWDWVDMKTATTNCVKWLEADNLDEPDPVLKDRPQLYSFDAVAYESIMLGVFELLKGPNNGRCALAGMPKNTDLEFGYSRDGFHYVRPDRTAAIRSERWASGKWDAGYVQPLSNLCVIMGDKLRFYYGAFAGNRQKSQKKGGPKIPSARNGMYDRGAMGFAELRRDGFVSLHAEVEGTMTTVPLAFDGSWLFVNVDCPAGELRVEVVDDFGRPIAPFTFENCLPIREDGVKTPVRWKGCETLSAMRGKNVRFRFWLSKGDLYSFWVSRWRTGESNGYLAGGGPGYAGLIDRPAKDKMLFKKGR